MAGGFPLTRWHATHQNVLTAVQAEKDQGSQITFDDCVTKRLGLRWLPQKDSFTFSTRISSHTDHLTKRLAWSEVAQILDPLGFLSPVVIKAKMLLQELWLHETPNGMNHCHPSSHHGGSLSEKNSQVCKLSIPRWYIQGNTSQTTWSTSSVEFHGFFYTSQLAMAAVVFITVHGSNGATISLVCSKTKVAPLKRLTIPRLELTAAQLLSRLMPYVQATLKLNVTATHLWTDSVVTLTWIKSHASRWKDFVRNRVSQIQELTANAHWKYVPAASQPDDHWDLIYRFIALLRGFWDGSLDSHSALEKARFFWIKATQAAYFTYEIKMLTANLRLPTAHAFSRLTAYIDAQGIIRVGGRLNQSALAQDNKHQAILPRHSRFSTLIIAHAHLRTLHGGTQLTLAHVRQQYWIIGGRAPELTMPDRSPSKTWKGRGAKTYKGWICVFVYFSTSAIHLEVVSDYSSEGFIATFRKFSARRGIAQTMYSDCGTTFIGADAALKKMFIQSSQEHQRITQILQHDRIRWEFNPPGAPHMGGKWEAVVKSEVSTETDYRGGSTHDERTHNVVYANRGHFQLAAFRTVE
ncbi:uncharacterized protein [Temnothorax longispinosus]|uniref:uncharacterized protein n=1 Tax=Temnothorax longispinosus TaxID=300112 RepID=UPI003A995521